MHYDFDTLPDRRSSDSIKWHTYPPDVLPMWVADMDFCSPEPVIRALRGRVEHGVFGYPEGLIHDPKSKPALRAAIISSLADRYRWQVQPDDIIFIPGVVTGCNLACHMAKGMLGPGGVMVQPPVYPPILGAAKNTGMLPQQAPLARRLDGSYAMDWEAFDSALTPETRLFILCNPHNPVGRVFTPQELAGMAERCLSHGVLICADEIHSDLVFQGHSHTPLASLDPEIAQHTITLMAPSKTFNLAGLEGSFAIIPNPELRKQYLGASQGLAGWVNLMALTAMEAAYREGQEWLDQLLAYLEANREALYSYVQNELPGVQMAKPEGTYLAWLDCRQTPAGENPYQFFLEKARVATNDGATFGPGGQGFVRLNYGCPRAMLLEALDRMRTALKS